MMRAAPIAYQNLRGRCSGDVAFAPSHGMLFELFHAMGLTGRRQRRFWGCIPEDFRCHAAHDRRIPRNTDSRLFNREAQP